MASTTSGLTRRRGGGGTTDPENDETDASRVNSPGPKPGPASESRAPETSFSSTGENGHKIAFDPRDISESEERNKQPKLTLMEEVLLIGLKDKQVGTITLTTIHTVGVNHQSSLQGYLSFWNDNISYALRGCIVIELAFRGRVSMQKDSSRRRFPLADRVIEVIDDTLTGEVLLDEALKMMKSSEKMSVSSWIDLMSGKEPLSPHPYHTLRRERPGRKLVLIKILTDVAHPFIDRRNVEPDEDRLSTETSARTPGQGPG